MTRSNIYLDFNATTPVDPKVQTKVQEWVSMWGNPSSIHQDGRDPKKILRESRRTLARVLGCHPLELIFTSGGSEANNLAIKGCAFEHMKTGKRRKILVGSIEHPSVLQQIPFLETLGFNVIKIPVDTNGIYDMEFYNNELDDSVLLVSVMIANNELGVLAPIEAMVKQAHGVGALFHSDLVQALGKTPFDLKQLDVDLASFSGHKVYALKGTGLLYVKKGTPLGPLINGGSQERGRRAGTENLMSIASLALMVDTLDGKAFEESIKPLRDHLEEQLQQKIPGLKILCSEQPRLANTSSFCIEGVSGESLLMNLDIRGFSVGTGAACSSGNPEPSPVLLAIGLTREDAQSSLRISLGKTTTMDEINSFIKNLNEVVEHLRNLEDAGEENYV